MKSETEDGKHEIIIVRRGGHDDDHEGHGGAWKIAFADFMTAMMCFFLVMWLINAANEDAKASIASYFNPVKLMDRDTNRKGIDDAGKGERSASSSKDPETTTDEKAGERRALTGPADQANATNLSETPKHSDQNMFADPYAILAEIAADTGQMQNVSSKGDGGANDAGPANGASGGESYRDPFAPDFWSSQVDPTGKAETAEQSLRVADAEKSGAKAAPTGEASLSTGKEAKEVATEIAADVAAKDANGKQPSKPAPAGVSVDAETEKLVALLAGNDPAKEKPSKDKAVADPSPPAAAIEAKAKAAQDAVAQASVAPTQEMIRKALEAEKAAELAKAEKLAGNIRTELSTAFGRSGLPTGLTVEPTQQGVMISIAEDMPDGMFEIGSAVPRKQLVLAMEKIGKALAEHKGPVTVNGHTDARPFANKDYDNWRLSTARAQSTYYMLVRGGLTEQRIVSVAGYADRKLKKPDEPLASINRRIEILLGTQ